MCNFKGNLVAWMDGELAPDVTVEVEKHLQGCADCRQRVAGYESASRDFAAYYVMRHQAQPGAVSVSRIPWWAPYVATAAAVLIATLVALPRPNKQAEEVRETKKVITPAAESLAEPATPAQPRAKVGSGHAPARNKPKAEEWQAASSAIQIAIPADAMFPPGAVPDGVAYIASLAPDGSIQSIRLQP